LIIHYVSWKLWSFKVVKCYPIKNVVGLNVVFIFLKKWVKFKKLWKMVTTIKQGILNKFHQIIDVKLHKDKKYESIAYSWFIWLVLF
jgi:hypothetical protein